jgi:hypothetical protein
MVSQLVWSTMLIQQSELIEKYKKLKVLQPDTTDTMNIDS